MGLDPREPLSPRVRSPRSNLLIGRGAGYRRTVFAVSLPILVVRISPYQVPVSFGLGTSRDAASCDASPDKHHRYVRPMSASQTLTTITRTRWLPALSTKLASRAERWALGPTALTGGGGAHAHPGLRFSVPHSPLVRGLRPSRGCYPPTRPMWPTSDTPVASPAPVFVGPVSRLRVGPPGQ